MSVLLAVYLSAVASAVPGRGPLVVGRAAAFLVAGGLVLAAGPVRAEECGNLSTMGMIECARGELERADARLNAGYKKLMAGADETGKALLRDAQRAWLRFRDTECAWEADSMRGGTGAAPVSLDCQARLTAERAAKLERILSDAPK